MLPQNKQTKNKKYKNLQKGNIVDTVIEVQYNGPKLYVKNETIYQRAI